MIVLDILERDEGHQRQVLQALTGRIPEEEGWNATFPAGRGLFLGRALRRWIDAPAGHLQEVLRDRLVEVAEALGIVPPIWKEEGDVIYDVPTDEQLSWWTFRYLRSDAKAMLQGDWEKQQDKKTAYEYDRDVAIQVVSTIGRRVVLTPEPERSGGIARFWTMTRDRPLTLQEAERAERALAAGRVEQFGLDPAPDNAFELYGYLVLQAIRDSEPLLDTPDWPIAAPYLAEQLASVLLREAPLRPTIKPLQASGPATRARRRKEMRGLAVLALAARAGRPSPPTSISDLWDAVVD